MVVDAIVVTNILDMESEDVEARMQVPVIQLNADEPYIADSDTAVISAHAGMPIDDSLVYDWETLDGGSLTGSGSEVIFTPESFGPHPCPYRIKVTTTSKASGLSNEATISIYVRRASDINADGMVNMVDLAALRAAFGQTGISGVIPADINRDGRVNFGDLAMLRHQFGWEGCVFLE